MTRRPDKRLSTMAAVCAAVLISGALVSLSMRAGDEGDLLQSPPLPVDARHDRATHQQFQQAVAMLHAGQLEFAVTALHEVLKRSPQMPEAHVNMGFALLGLGRLDAAGPFFDTAIELRPGQVNAYYGLALVEKASGRTAEAIAAMQVFTHLAGDADPYLARGQSLLGQWRIESSRDGS